jgi:hypothetical protein
MICFDGDPTTDGRGRVAVARYMSINDVAVDEEVPTNVLALLCVAEGNHPFGDLLRMRPANWEWKPENLNSSTPLDDVGH